MSAWKASVPFFTVSMHTKKNSILTPFLANKLKKMAEFGITKIISKRHIIPKSNCKPLNVKGQLISKCLFGVFNSLKNERKQFDLRYHSSKVEFFGSFLGELKIPKRHFEIN